MFGIFSAHGYAAINRWMRLICIYIGWNESPFGKTGCVLLPSSGFHRSIFGVFTVKLGLRVIYRRWMSISSESFMSCTPKVITRWHGRQTRLILNRVHYRLTGILLHLICGVTRLCVTRFFLGIRMKRLPFAWLGVGLPTVRHGPYWGICDIPHKWDILCAAADPLALATMQVFFR